MIMIAGLIKYLIIHALMLIITILSYIFPWM